ncbi:MAG: hypothetical protein A2Y38_04675 [Spirochaetes bacterium GWB1_59_5]|nr:MAG: hypothetical protein A2Y38_04675 [Spirochaetes bacterium GWB1_59_5]
MTTELAVPECAPFFKENSGAECCLCIHGFTGCPALYIPLSKLLFDAGFSVSVPLLAGHGTAPENLRGVSELQWFQDQSEELGRLLARYQRVHLIGLSLGGAIAAWLAATYAGNKHLGKLVLLSPGLGLKDKKFYGIDYEKTEDSLIPLPRRPLKDDGLNSSRYGYPAMPLRSVGQLLLAANRANQALGAIRAPTLLLYTAADQIADPAACERAAGAIPSLESCNRYEAGEHNLLLGPDRLDVIERVMSFVGGRNSTDS